DRLLHGVHQAALIDGLRFGGNRHDCRHRGNRDPDCRGESLMVPVEATAFALLAICVIILAGLLFFTMVFPRDAAILARSLLVPALVVVVALAVYVLVTTRVR